MARTKLFVGGIHGAGKGSFCKKLVEKYLCEYISASSLLNWNNKTKQVQDVDRNQKILSDLLLENTSSDSSYVIDGHFALWNKSGLSEMVPLDTFVSLGLSGIVLITCSADIVCERLNERDGVLYEIDRIQDLQNIEIKQAKYVSESLNIPLFVLDTTHSISYEVILPQIDKIMKKYTRDNIYSEMLKTVIIRLDFSGIINIGPFVETIKKVDVIESNFASFEEISQRQLNVSFVPKDIEDGGLPIAKTQDKTIYRFSKWKMPNNSEALLDIDNSSITIVVECGINYKGSKSYSDVIVNLMCELKKYDQYVSFKRLGVRKIDAKVITNGEEIRDYFNEKFVVGNTWMQNHYMMNDMSTLTELFHIDDVRFNVVQRIERYNEKDIRLFYDVDSYIEANVLGEIDNEHIGEYLNEKMQDKMFDMFVNVASEVYLEKCKKMKEKING